MEILRHRSSVDASTCSKHEPSPPYPHTLPTEASEVNRLWHRCPSVGWAPSPSTWKAGREGAPWRGSAGRCPSPTKKDRPVEAQGRGDQAKEEDPSWPGSGGTRASPEFRKMAPEKLTQSRPCAQKHKGNGGGCGWRPGIWRGGVCVVPAGLTALREQVSHAAKSTRWHFLRLTPQNSHFVGHPKRREDLLKRAAWGFPPT